MWESGVLGRIPKGGGKVGSADFSTARHFHGASQTRGEKVKGLRTKQVSP
jgi:hypothetical protein